MGWSTERWFPGPRAQPHRGPMWYRGRYIPATIYCCSDKPTPDILATNSPRMEAPSKLRAAIGYLLAHKFIAALAIFLLSFSIRLAMLAYVGHIERRGAAEVDSIALALLHKHQFADPYAVPTGPTAHTTPFYPVLVAGVYAIFGTGYTGNLVRALLVIGAYSLLYALYVWLAPSFGFSEGAGLIAGFCSALLPVRRSAEVFLGWEEPYAAMALAAILLLTLRHWRAPTRTAASALAIGACWGMAFYVSFSLATVLAALVLLDLAVRPSWATLRDNVLIGVAAVVLMSPWVIRNCVQLHGRTLMRTTFGVNLWYANNDHARPSAELINTDPIARNTHPYTSVEEAMKVKQMGELAYDHQDLQMALAWIRAHPARFMNLTVRRFLYFWGGPPEHPYELVVTSLYTLLGLFGFFSMKRWVGVLQWQIWLAALLSFPFMYYFVQYTSRYRTPIDWMVALLAGQEVIILLKQFAVRNPVSSLEETQTKRAEVTKA